MKENPFAFKNLFWAYTFGSMPFMLLGSFLSLFNVVPVYFNNEPHYGFEGFIIMILFIPFFGLIMGFVNWIYLNFGNYLYRKTFKLIRRDQTGS
ncbi:hypothetical protein SAMN05518672_102252 [Chitinophaga sp. CF118]|uniref:hypothetical protein n=1 Tax=Chitinophaga sp. CF118 TaxID=1884367 RepID=UPI0008E51372|nr:hypothetical protein [Chitinophaga sp. CF118]SFD51376.1 hypothetical protein SAMN05518672_102252 [Chitinophaga sp. CF118]